LRTMLSGRTMSTHPIDDRRRFEGPTHTRTAADPVVVFNIFIGE
jgi:hypothetical protein